MLSVPDAAFGGRMALRAQHGQEHSTGTEGPGEAGERARARRRPSGRSAADGRRSSRCVGVTHRFGEVVALDGVSIIARQGEFLTILGQSGSGKTTLLRIISGLEKPTQVERLAIAGQDVHQRARRPTATARRCSSTTRCSRTCRSARTSSTASRCAACRSDRAPRSGRSRALALVRLDDKYGRRVHQLSGGERQRVALARALVTQARDPAARRAARRARREAPARHAGRAARAAQEARHDLRLHHPLPGRGAHHERPGDPDAARARSCRRARRARCSTGRSSRFVADFMGVENILEGDLAGARGRAARRSGRRPHDRRPVVRPAAAGAPGSPVVRRHPRRADASSTPTAPRARTGSTSSPAGRRPRSTRASISTRASRPISARSRRGSGTVDVDVSRIDGLWWAESGLHDHAEHGQPRGQTRRLSANRCNEEGGKA